MQEEDSTFYENDKDAAYFKTAKQPHEEESPEAGRKLPKVAGEKGGLPVGH